MQTIGTPDDRKAYRSYRVRKMSSLVQKCIAKGIKFNKSGKVLKYKRRPIAPVPPPITQSATVYPPSQSWPGSQFPYYGYNQAGYKYLAPHIPSQQLNQVNQPFSTGFKFQQFATSTPQSYQQTGANRTAPTPPPPFIPTNVTPPTEFPTDLSGF